MILDTLINFLKLLIEFYQPQAYIWFGSDLPNRRIEMFKYPPVLNKLLYFIDFIFQGFTETTTCQKTLFFLTKEKGY